MASMIWQSWMRLAITFVMLVSPSRSERFSYSRQGEWLHQPSEFCKQTYLCNVESKSWVTNPPSVVFDQKSACNALVRSGIKQVYTYSDSYMRHIYSAMLIILSGNYKSGCLDQESANCLYDNQFETECNRKGLKTGTMTARYVTLCDGQIQWYREPVQPRRLPSIAPPMGTVLDRAGPSGKLLLWSMANHPLAMKTRYGVNDAKTRIASFQDQCATKRHAYEHVIWLSTHARVIQLHKDEAPLVVKTFNEQLRQFFDSGHCGGQVSYIDVYNMTASLVFKRTGTHPQDFVFRKENVFGNLTFDGVHWGMTVNLLKAQIILNAIADHKWHEH